MAVISLISSSFFSIMVFMASSADSLALSFSAHLHSTQELVKISYKVVPIVIKNLLSFYNQLLHEHYQLHASKGHRDALSCLQKTKTLPCHQPICTPRHLECGARVDKRLW